MQASPGATPEEISWVLTSYILASAVAMPITGWLSDRVGSRRLFLWSVSGFVITSMLCGMAQNITEMVLFRALQGVTGAFIGPLSQTAMIDVNKPSRQAQMMAIWGMGIMVGPILGPILGGWLTENWNWRAVFYVNLPLGAVALLILFAGLPSRPLVRRRFDVFGFAMLTVCLSSLQLLLDRGTQIDWFDSLEAWIYAALIVLQRVDRRHPLRHRARAAVSARLFATRNFARRWFYRWCSRRDVRDHGAAPAAAAASVRQPR
jgi:DHA2 family multidrug resistance protein